MNEINIELYVPSREVPDRTPKAVIDGMSEFIQGKVVCDLGCAEGDTMVFMSKYAKEVIGFEFDKARGSVAEEKGLNVVYGDYFKDDLPEAEVYYFWPDEGAKVNEFLINKIHSNENWNGTIIVGGDKSFYPEPEILEEQVRKWKGDIKDISWEEKKTDHHRSGSGVFSLCIIIKPNPGLT
mgnify:CR=1 FL=1